MSEESSEGTVAVTGIVAAEGKEIGHTIMRPLGDRVIVIEEDAPEKTTSGIYLPENTRETTRRGVVIALGPGKRSPLTGEPVGIGISPGDRVVYEPMSGTELTVDGQRLLVIREENIISVFSETDAPE
jgi:chaperonin GroES